MPLGLIHKPFIGNANGNKSGIAFCRASILAILLKIGSRMSFITHFVRMKCGEKLLASIEMPSGKPQTWLSQ